MNLMATFNHALLTPSQVFFGYDMDEALRLVRYCAESPQPKAGFFTDYFGIRTRLSNFMHDPAQMDQAVGAFPFPNDGLHSELIEYLGTAKALEASGKDLCVVELGAGYGPWLLFSAVVARRLGASSIRLVAVEAEAQRHALIREHFDENGFARPEVIHGAISDTRGTVNFGSENVHDWGGAVQGEAGGDYRGAPVVAQEVPTLTINDVLVDLPGVDLLHIDIQGWETRSIRASLDAVCSKVRYMVIGTHSRVIEGELIDMLRGRGWSLMHEKPCQFSYEDTPELAGATTVDGAQVWANTALGAPNEIPSNLTHDERSLADKARESVGWQHRIAKEHVWILQNQIMDLQAVARIVPKWLQNLLIARRQRNVGRA